jgi:hypothetical protein
MSSARSLNIFVIDWSTTDVVMAISRALHPTGLGIMNVGDMVDKILRQKGLISGTSVIKTLNIIGHGNKSGMYLGADWVDDSTFPNFQTPLSSLARYFSNEGDAVVALGGCKVGRNQKLLSLFSNTFGGVRVKAWSADQRPLLPGDEGGESDCYYNNCSYSGATMLDRLDGDD